MTGCGYNPAGKTRPVAHRGVIDLRGWDFNKDGGVTLDGEWEFYWNRLLKPSDITPSAAREDCGYMTVPGLWKNRIVKGAALPGDGQATYRLRILGGGDATLKTVTIQRVYSAYRLWINKKLVDERGSIDETSKVPENYIFIHNKRNSSFTMNEGTNEIIIQVFNRDYGSGGIDRSILLENNANFEQNMKRSYTIDMVLFGLLIFASVINILSYFFRRQDSASLYFGTYCLILAINTLNHQFPLLPDGLTIPRYPYYLNYITIVIYVPFILMTVKSLFPDDMSIYFVRFYQIVAVLHVPVLLFVDFKTAEELIKVYYFLGFILIIYNAYVLAKVIIKRREDAILFIFGFTPVFIGAVNDILYAMWVVNTTTLTQYGVVMLSIVITIVISRRYSRALWRVEELSKDLAEKNITLRNLDRLKDQFLATTSHELRTPLHGMIGLSESMLEGAAGSMSPEARENLSLIASSGHRLANMVNDILDWRKSRTRD
ncbi:MAG TPA: 7TM diverse intracellular signaling domain-containing protein [Spirochaetota bacterium]|nr:7TM diverse intracellular signaling domain-containing protein [Spirochaetota bacterium]HPC42574.1 7TM diverse intracellular signaling domain-containing protein [Spirochaetota bacterium]HQF08406.1 7TM diverse intracellular signaling domain-containing protein [Spirochaetota bacterium]HQH99043.1 7TM diverse intracellular signaling domain-containing protein [Spirochaetota bacterium]HQJ72661.1 7TM diverse intracellular signaling domain-containing protein [Spirochaetota bacterium]